MNELKWNLIRAFLAVARLGSLSAAARELGVSQPTLSRDIQALEASTGLHLFRRTTRGLQLTEQGRRLVESAGDMDDAADRFARQAAGLSLELAGEVRISANEIVGVYLLPPALAAFRQRHPGVQVELVISNAASSLSKREADIALRMFRPDQPDLVARRLPDLALGFYAHRDYLARRGTPADAAGLRDHDLIGFDLDTTYIDTAAAMGLALTPRDFALRSDQLLAQLGLLRAGAGIGATHVGLAAHWPALVRILDQVSLPPLQLWCVTHGDVQYSARIRALMQFLVQWLGDAPYAHALV